MLSAFRNVTRIPELRQRILFTIAVIFVVRLGANLPLPGVSIDAISAFMREARHSSGNDPGASLGAMLAMFTGGATQQAGLFSLGIMPYISASIIIQMLTVLWPPLAKLSREDGGRQKINQWTRILAILLAIGQGFMLVQSLKNPESNPLMRGFNEATFGKLVPDPSLMGYMVPALTAIVAGTLLLMWLGEMITEKGIGNGTSVIITVNIAAQLPGALVMVWKSLLSGEGRTALSGVQLVFLVVLLLLVIAGVIAITEAQRRIPVQYPKQARAGKRIMGGTNQTQYLPLKVNYAGVMPIIFASALMTLPIAVLPMLFGQRGWIEWWQNVFTNGHWPYYLIMVLMIFGFSYFWVSIMFQPQQMADDLKRAGGYIPGIRPGDPTATFLDNTMSRLTFAGAVFLSLLAVFPPVVTHAMPNVPPLAIQIFGGTSILIMVGVILDIMRQLETHLIQRNYEGFLRKGRLKGARFGRVGGSGQVVRKDQAGAMLWLYVALAGIALAGTVMLLIHRDREAEDQPPVPAQAP